MLPPPEGLALFAASALVLNLTPGADMLFVAGSSVAHGRRSGVLAALGVGAGCLLHLALGALGFAALLAASPLAFAALRWAGAAYLVWLGIGLLRQRAVASAPPGVGAGARVFWQGALTNALNPKVALFFLAFLPQFVPAGEGPTALGFVVLGAWFTVSGTLVNVAVALLAGRLRQRVTAGAGAGWMRRLAGAVFVALGLRMALATR